MKKITKTILITIIFVILAGSIVPSVAEAYSAGMSASVVISQPDFNSFGLSFTVGGLNTPSGAKVANGKIIVPDNGNHRVLIWNSIPTTNGVIPDVVIGQIDLNHNSVNAGGGGASRGANTLGNPSGSFFDGTRLYIADVANSRVLIYNSIPTSNNASADVVVGQANFLTASVTIAANRMNSPRGIFVDPVTGKLVVVDSNNNRVLIFNSVPTTNGASADVVIGQADFTHNSANQGGGTTAAANTLSAPRDAIVTPDGKLLISDMTNNRILIYNSIPTTNNASADLVLGQNNFTSSTVNQGGGINAGTFSGPWGLWYDTGRLYVADANNARVLIFNSFPTSNNALADLVIGEPDFTQALFNASASGFSTTRSVFVINNQMFVSDSGGNRVLIFNNNIVTPLINLNAPPTPTDDPGKYRLTGNVFLNKNSSTYALQTLKADLNGTGPANITLPGGRDDGAGNTIFDFTYDFDPTVGLGSINNLTLKLLATTVNNDTNSLFYFLPFKFTSFNVANTKSQNFTFTVNKDQLQRVKDNLNHFEVWYKPNTTTGKWATYISNISKDMINKDGLVVATKTDGTKFVGGYAFEIVAVDNWSNRQESNLLYTAGTGPVTKTNYTSFAKSFVTPPPASSATGGPTPINTLLPVPAPSPTSEITTTSNLQLDESSFLKLIFIISSIAALILLIILSKRKLLTSKTTPGEGILYDAKTNEPIKGAVLTFKNQAKGSEIQRQVTTDANGNFGNLNLPSGIYKVTIKNNGNGFSMIKEIPITNESGEFIKLPLLKGSH